MSILKRIVERTRARLDAAATPLAEVRARAAGAPPRASFRAACAAAHMSLVAEAKRASPSRGVLRDPYDAGELAVLYERAGAHALSVLTEPEFFRGFPEDLQRAAKASPLPILRKDFIVSEIQVWEAKAWGASAVLLIVAAIDGALLRDLLAMTREAGLDALVEAHTEKEAEAALAAGAGLLGANNRDLSTFTVDLHTTARIAALVPPEVVLIAESGISSREDVLFVEKVGARAVLVGESLLTSDDPARKIRELLGRRLRGAEA